MLTLCYHASITATNLYLTLTKPPLTNTAYAGPGMKLTTFTNTFPNLLSTLTLADSFSLNITHQIEILQVKFSTKEIFLVILTSKIGENSVNFNIIFSAVKSLLLTCINAWILLIQPTLWYLPQKLVNEFMPSIQYIIIAAINTETQYLARHSVSVACLCLHLAHTGLPWQSKNSRAACISRKSTTPISLNNVILSKELSTKYCGSWFGSLQARRGRG